MNRTGSVTNSVTANLINAPTSLDVTGWATACAVPTNDCMPLLCASLTFLNRLITRSKQRDFAPSNDTGASLRDGWWGKWGCWTVKTSKLTHGIVTSAGTFLSHELRPTRGCERATHGTPAQSDIVSSSAATCNSNSTRLIRPACRPGVSCGRAARANFRSRAARISARTRRCLSNHQQIRLVAGTRLD